MTVVLGRSENIDNVLLAIGLIPLVPTHVRRYPQNLLFPLSLIVADDMHSMWTVALRISIYNKQLKEER